MQGPLSLAIFDCAGKSRGDDRPCMLGLGIDLKRTEEINLPLSPRLRGFGISPSSGIFRKLFIKIIGGGARRGVGGELVMSSTVRMSGASGAKSGPSVNSRMVAMPCWAMPRMSSKSCCVRIHDRKRFYVKQLRCENRSCGNLPVD